MDFPRLFQFDDAKQKTIDFKKENKIMFKCRITGKTSKRGEKLNRIVVETRPKTYYNEEGEVIGEGFEIVEEINASEEGLAIWLEEKKNSY